MIVTRNYLGFAKLADAYRREGRDYPGILFISSDIGADDVDRHVELVEAWLQPDSGPESDPANRYVWLG